MKKIFFLLTLIAIATPKVLEAARTLNIKYTGRDRVSLAVSLPGLKDAFNNDIFVTHLDLGTFSAPEKEVSKSISNSSFVIKNYKFLYTVPAGKDGDTICLEVDDTSVKACKK